MPLAHPASPALTKLCAAFEALTLENVDALLACYAATARFKDPFNEVVGQAAIGAIFRHMFTQVDAPRFTLVTVVEQGQDAFITWDFTFRMKRWNPAPQCIHGASHLQFGEDGKVTLHRDYWDAAEELYEKLPVLGGLMRALKRAART